MNVRITWLIQLALIPVILSAMAYAGDVSPSPQPSLDPLQLPSAQRVPQGEGEKEGIQIPDTVATVNGVDIIRQDLERRMVQSRAMNPERFDAISLEERKKAITRTIDNMILREVIYQEAARRDIIVAEKDVDLALDALKRRFPSEDAFQKAFADADITVPVWKVETKKNMMGMKLEELMVNELKISDSEITDYYKKNKGHLNKDAININHILIETEEEAQKVIEELKKDNDFGGLAKKYSQDIFTKDKGGDLGWFGRGELLKEVEEAAYSLTPGQMSGPVKSQFGYHIIRLNEKKSASEQTLEDHREHVGSILQQVKWQKLKPAWQGGLLTNAKVWKWSP